MWKFTQLAAPKTEYSIQELVMKTFRWLLVALFPLMLLAGCGGNVQEDDKAGGDQATVETGAVTGAGGIEGETLGADGKPTSMRIHFEFDSSNISDDGRVTLEAHAAFLSKNKDARIKLEGHCDERGTREYNLALGERRANSAAKLLRAMGVEAARVEVTSYGEEKPLDDGHDEAAWSQNRRVEIIYR